LDDLFAWNPGVQIMDGGEKENVGIKELSFRETQILRLIVLGMRNKQIAETLGLSIETIKTHIKSILSKFSASSRTQVAVKALKSGLIKKAD
jgi:DNA-binding NarL/FixJ family response regulator